MSLLNQRCWNHPGREAAARCPSCQRYYCRECVTEHDQRMVCAACVAGLGPAPAATHSGGGVKWVFFSATGLLLAWLIFYYLGMALARIPSTFHGDAP